MKRNPDRLIDRIRLKMATATVCKEVRPLLRRIQPNLIYANSVNAVVCEGILQALRTTYLPGRAPFLIAELPFRCEPGPRHFYGQQLAAMFRRLKRSAARQNTAVASNPLDRFAPITVDQQTASLLAQTVDAEIGVLPSPYAVRTRRQLVAGQPPQPLRIGSVGHQRESKGFHYLPAIFETLSNLKNSIQWVVQHQNDSDPTTLEKLRQMQSQGFQIELIDEELTRDAYEQLLLGLDIILLPYKPEHYQSMISGICYEGLSQGNIVVAPRHTSVGKIIGEFQPLSPQFDEWTVDSISTALDAAIDSAASLNAAAIQGASLFAQAHGPDAFASAIASKAVDDVAFKAF
ncbi:hypothetical protein [Rosistilla oblonga]